MRYLGITNSQAGNVTAIDPKSRFNADCATAYRVCERLLRVGCAGSSLCVQQRRTLLPRATAVAAPGIRRRKMIMKSTFHRARNESKLAKLNLVALAALAVTLFFS